jgi:hypothetical protein
MNTHKFDFQLPMEPNSEKTTLLMDRQPLEGVTSLHVKAGTDGFTNVAVEFNASCALSFTGHLIANIKHEGEEQSLLLAGMHDRAMAYVCDRNQVEPDVVIMDYQLKAEFLMVLASFCIEELAGA